MFWLGAKIPVKLHGIYYIHNKISKKLLGGELNPGLLCDRQGYSPLYYQGTATNIMKFSLHYLLAKDLQCGSCEHILPCTFASSHTVAYVGLVNWNVIGKHLGW